MIDKSSGVPVYKQIAAAIRTNIERNVYPVGSKLPSEDVIAANLGVSRGTVRQALSELSSQGIVKRIHGNGTFVSERGNECKIETDHFISFLDSIEGIGIPVETVVLDKNIIIPEGSLRDFFPGNTQLYQIKRLRKNNGKPIMFSVDHIPCDCAPNIDRIYDNSNSVYDFLEKNYPFRISKVKRIFYAICANGEVAKALSIKRGEPVFFIIQQAFDGFGHCVDYANLYVLSEEVHFSISTNR